MSLVFSPAGSEGWLLLATESRAVIVDASQRTDLLDAAWPTMGDTSGFQVLIDLLTRQGLAATPSFALLDWSAEPKSLRVLLRGDVSLSVLGDDAATMSAVGVSTWVERNFSGVTGAQFDIPGADALHAQLPLVAGAGFAASVTFDFATDGSDIPAENPPVTARASQSDESAGEKSAPEPVPDAAAAPQAPPVPAVATSAAPPPAPAGYLPPPVAPPLAGPPAPHPSPRTEPVDIEATVTGARDGDFGATMYRSLPEGADSTQVPAAPDLDGDHDGHTVLTSDIARIKKKRRPSAAAAEQAIEPAGAIALTFSTGQRELLDQTILVGRSPSVSKVSAGLVPKFVTVGGVEQDISRNHVQVALEGDTVVVTDLHSRNGTSVILPGKSAQKLRGGEPATVILGTVIDLGGGITIAVDEA